MKQILPIALILASCMNIAAHNAIYHGSISIVVDDTRSELCVISDTGSDNLIGEVPQLARGTYNNACGYDANGNLIRDNSRGITSILYNPLNLPSNIQFDENNLIYNYYRADGVKSRSLNRTKYISTTIKINANGDTIITQRVKANDRLRQYYGDLLRENGKVKRIYNEAGYVDIDEAAGTHKYNFYVRDYLGSVKAVVGANGELWQFTDYHVTGIPSSQFGALNADDRLHTGKEYNAFNGLHMYDNNARSQDPILGRFTTIDPLAEAYPNFSPYAHCVNNSLKHIDPDGRQSFEVYNEIRTERIKLLTTPGNEYIETLKSNNADDVIVSNATIGTASGIVGFGSIIGKAVQLIQRIVANNEQNGTIYEVSGGATKSGKPYIGRHNKPNPEKTRKSNDGRDRTKAKVVDRYDAKDVDKGRYKEQKAIDERGGVEKLDNKRNEVSKKNMEEYERRYK